MVLYCTICGKIFIGQSAHDRHVAEAHNDSDAENDSDSEKVWSEPYDF
jgi:uncharacterized C2H2 Zn-finger protein